MKMRLRFQKKSRSNSRRHTVANIGLPDISSLRSVFDNCGGNQKKSGSSASSVQRTPDNYHYVRKWSVDITALANQLENPKAHTGSYPILRERSVTENLLSPEFNSGKITNRGAGTRGTVTTTSIRQRPPREVGKKTSPLQTDPIRRSRSGEVEIVGNERIGEKYKTDFGTVPPSSPLTSSAMVEPQIKCHPPPIASPIAATNDERDSQIVRLDEVDTTDSATCIFEPPSIVVSVSAEDPDEEHDAKDPSNEDSRHTGRHCQPPSMLMSIRSICSAHLVTEDRSGDDVSSDVRVAQQLIRAQRTVFLLLLALLMTLPYTVVSIVDLTTSGAGGIHWLYNARLVTGAVAMLQAALFPLVIVWVDQSLRAKIRRWWKSTRRLRCMCYCNVGPGKSCCRMQRQPPPLEERKKRSSSKDNVH